MEGSWLVEGVGMLEGVGREGEKKERRRRGKINLRISAIRHLYEDL